MSMDVSGVSGVAASAGRDEAVIQALLAKASAINAASDRNFVRNVLGKDRETSKKACRRLSMQLHRDRLPPGMTEQERAACDHAVGRINGEWRKVHEPNRGMDVDQAVALASQPVSPTTTILHVAAGLAERGLHRARSAWDAKVADGTVEAVKARATDLFETGLGLARAGWAEAIKRAHKPTNKGDQS